MAKNYTRWIGLVTAIEFDLEKTDCVKVYFDMFDRYDVSDTYTFTDIFGRGKANFERFLRTTCDIEKNGIAIPKNCVGSYLAILVEHKRGRIVGFCPLNEKEQKLNLDYCFKDSKLHELETEEVIKEYACILYNENGITNSFDYFSCMRNVKAYENRENTDDITLRIRTNIFNNKEIQWVDYYINGIFDAESEKFNEFCENYGISDEDIDNCKTYDDLEKVIENKTAYVPSKASIYYTRKGTIYISEIAPYDDKTGKLREFLNTFKKYNENEHNNGSFFSSF